MGELCTVMSSICLHYIQPKCKPTSSTVGFQRHLSHSLQFGLAHFVSRRDFQEDVNISCDWLGPSAGFALIFVWNSLQAIFLHCHTVGSDITRQASDLVVTGHAKTELCNKSWPSATSICMVQKILWTTL